jgi:DNA-directed RNA polymerase subunit M/transcription elongation factor TFIIS
MIPRRDDYVSKYLAFVTAYKHINKSKYEVIGTSAHMNMCNNCGNRTIVRENAQLRSADEEASLVYWCMTCGVRSATM